MIISFLELGGEKKRPGLHDREDPLGSGGDDCEDVISFGVIYFCFLDDNALIATRAVLLLLVLVPMRS